jgi:hypothetical protein
LGLSAHPTAVAVLAAELTKLTELTAELTVELTVELTKLLARSAKAGLICSAMYLAQHEYARG